MSSESGQTHLVETEEEELDVMLQASPVQAQEFPPQHQDRHPGLEAEMSPRPIYEDPRYRAAGKLEGQAALITGGDSGIGRAIVLLYAKEGADVAIAYLDEHEDAREAKRLVEEQGRRCILLAGDQGDEAFCRQAVERTVEELGGLDILVNNAAEQHITEGLEQLSAEQLERTFRTNIFGYIFLAKAALPHMKPGSAIINTASIQSFKPSPELVDYAATKGAILNFTRCLAQELAPKGIRVNAVAPGPVWTPLIPSSFSAEDVQEFGADSPMQRAAQPCEMAPAYVYLACSDSSYVSGEVIVQAGGKIAAGA